MQINKNYNESNLETMAKMPDCFIDLTVTSPPYDNLRNYKGYSFQFEHIAKELHRVTKQGGVLFGLLEMLLKTEVKAERVLNKLYILKNVGLTYTIQ